VAQCEIGKPVGERRQAPAGMDQDRHIRGFGEREHVRHLLAVECERLRARMQLDPARPLREAALGLGERAVGRIEPAERDEPPVAFTGPLEHAVVRDRVGRVALGIVQRKHARPPRVGRVELPQQLVERQRPPVLVQAEVRVRVDHFRVRRAQALGFGQEWRERCHVELVEPVVHARHDIRSGQTARCPIVAVAAYPGSSMAILDQIRVDLQGAMRAGEKDRVGALRLVLSELQKSVKEGSDDELAVLRRERKRRLEAASAYRDAGRDDLAGGEQAEAELIGGYLPAELSDEDLQAIVERAVRESGAQSVKDMGQAMKQAMAAVDGRADGKRVSGLVRASLQG
jgi:uncharacterized protein